MVSLVSKVFHHLCELTINIYMCALDVTGQIKKTYGFDRKSSIPLFSLVPRRLGTRLTSFAIIEYKVLYTTYTG